MKIVSKLLACSVGFFAATQLHAVTNVLSDPVGFFKVPIATNANWLSAPMQPLATYRGTVLSVSGTNITFAGTPNFTVNQFNRVTNGALRLIQYMVIVRNDLHKNSTIPTGVATNDITGDWWKIIETPDSATIAVDPGFDTLSTALEAGDTLEIRKLVSLADLFGPPDSTSVLAGTAGNTDNGTGDNVKVVVGLSFIRTIVRNSTLSRYAAGLQNFSNGTTYTFEPDETFVYQRVAPAGPTNFTSLGQVPTTRITHYFDGSPSGVTPNPFGTHYPANQTYITSGMKEMIQLAGASSTDNVFQDTGVEDGIKEAVGLSFIRSVCLNGSGVFKAGLLTMDNTNIFPGQAYVYYVKTATGGRVWRQPLPYTP